MKIVLLLVCCAVLCGCETTGDPTQGGLFGWSEKKADERIAERQTTLEQAQENARQSQAEAAALRRDEGANAEELREEQSELSQLLADTEELEREAPTPAGASRARVLHRRIDAVRKDESLPAEARWSLLRRYAAEVDLLRTQAAGSAGLRPARAGE